MLGWFRARGRHLAAATLVSLTALGGWSSAAHGIDCHDDDCAALLLSHDPYSHGVGATQADSGHPLHCILCHWTRSIRPSTETAHQIARPITTDVRPPIDVPAALSPVQAAQPPLRSPPATVLTA